MNHLTSTHFMKRYWAGIAVSVIGAGFTAFMSLLALSSTGYDILGVMYLAVTGGVPLLIALIVCWIYYVSRDRGGASPLFHVVMILPTLLALGIVPIGLGIEQMNRNNFDVAHPPIQETHINLSGKDLWLTVGNYGALGIRPPALPMNAMAAQRFLSFSRIPQRSEVEAGQLPYAGYRLRNDIDTYTYSTKSSGGVLPDGPTLPLVRLPYPDLGPKRSIPQESYPPEPGYILQYQYFHYPDHVEVVPTRESVGISHDDFLQGIEKGQALFHVVIATAHPVTLIRMEVEGQNLKLNNGYANIKETRCRYGYIPLGMAIADIDQAIRLRWQTLEEPQHWHEATVKIPAFANAISPDAQPGPPQVLLYLQGDNEAAAERFQEIQFPGKNIALRATGLPSSVDASTVCGSAKIGYSSSVPILENP